MLYIGCHLSYSKGYEAMGRQALEIGANTFAFFTRNPRGGSAKQINPEDVSKLAEIMSANNFGKLVVHAPYTMNLCSDNWDTRRFGRKIMADDLMRMEAIPGNYYNFHPGCHMKQGADKGIELIAENLNSILSPEQSTTVLLETMAGKGTEIGRNFEELRAIIDRTECSDKLGVCLDTCHIWDGGYDVANKFDDILEEFDCVVGIKRLKAIHLNDSLNPCGSHKDRHAKIGEGHIGAEALINVINHPALKNLPIILETPNDMDGYKKEIDFLRKNYSE
ncbi:MAG: deoxyribonuclease IV [Ruminococcus flavefaciens]|nr:deoxyribonuclease IV [Ruminococcus flavefaciens]MCM1229811.1 deoxyribonuclease IV [Ruminococcus flavefaciens]